MLAEQLEFRVVNDVKQTKGLLSSEAHKHNN